MNSEDLNPQVQVGDDMWNLRLSQAFTTPTVNIEVFCNGFSC